MDVEGESHTVLVNVGWVVSGSISTVKLFAVFLH